MLNRWIAAPAIAGLVSGAIVVGAGFGGHWTDPGARLVDGIWIGPEVACRAPRDNCEDASNVVRVAMQPSEVAQIAWVDLPTEFVTFAGEVRSPHFFIGVKKRTAALVTLVDGHERVVGLMCGYDFSGCFLDGLEEWRDGTVPRLGLW